jgi:beta-galactosidase
LLWTELPINGSSNLGTISGTPEYLDNARRQLRELIRQNYNHPSVIVWGLFNEMYDSVSARNVISSLDALANQEDPSRRTTAASWNASPTALDELPDTIAFNRYFGWKSGALGDWGPWLDRTHAAVPTLAFGVSEYGAGACATQHEENPPRPPIDGAWHPDDYQSRLHEAIWPQLAVRPFLWCKLVWVMFDFASDDRIDGAVPGRNDKGLVTADRLTRKDAYYFYKATWSSQPVLKLTDAAYTTRPARMIEVKVYSNLDSVELWVNGTSMGKRTSVDHVLRWAGVSLRVGANDIRVAGTRAGDATVYRDAATWNAPARGRRRHIPAR